MRVYLFSLLLLILVHSTSGQSNYFTHKTLKKGNEFSFPAFDSKSDSLIARNINQYLQLSELEVLDGYQTSNIFENVNVDNGTIFGGKNEMSFQIVNNSAKVLSLVFDESSCGATCAYWVKYYNFNSGNGDPIQIKDLIKIEDYHSFYQMVLKKREAKFKNEILKIKSDQREYLLEYLDCFKNDRLHDFYISDTTLTIDGENCLSKNDKFLGVSMKTKFNLNEFKSFLNNYGKTVFGILDDSIFNYHSVELPQLYEGTIDSSLNILMIIDYDGKKDVIGGYAYLKFGKLISFEGELINKNLFLTEKDSKFSDNGFIDAGFDGNSIKGTWTNKNKTKSFKLIAIKRKYSAVRPAH